MSKARIENKVKIELAVISGGRCERCNIYLLEDFLTKTPVKFAEHAHIIPDSDDGPRGKECEYVVYKEGVENLMFLCPTCHKIIDKAPENFTVKRLREIKQCHEERIKRLTEIKETERVLVVKYGSRIGDSEVFLQNTILKIATVNNNFYPADAVIDFSSNSVLADNEKDYYSIQLNELERKFEKQAASIRECEKIILFGLAPQPLLFKLGTLFDKKQDVVVKQRSRALESWDWAGGSSSVYKVNIPVKPNLENKVSLIFALSAEVDRKRIIEAISGSFDEWIVTTDSPNMNIVQSRDDIDNFGKIATDIFEKIKTAYGANKTIEIFMVMPNSLAIELGRVYMTKVYNKLNFYDSTIEGEKRIFKYCCTFG